MLNILQWVTEPGGDAFLRGLFLIILIGAAAAVIVDVTTITGRTLAKIFGKEGKGE